MDRRLDFGLRVLTVALTAAAGVAAFRADYGPDSNAIADVRAQRLRPCDAMQYGTQTPCARTFLI